MFRTALVVVISATALAAPASERNLSDDAKVEKRLAGLVPGQPQGCITPSRSEGGDHFGNTVLIKDRTGTLYRTSLRGGCTVGFTDVLVSQRPTERLCTGDIIQIQDRQMGIFRGACTYNEFVPYRKPK